jgi:hypothetical protein
MMRPFRQRESSAKLERLVEQVLARLEERY